MNSYTGSGHNSGCSSRGLELVVVFFCFVSLSSILFVAKSKFLFVSSLQISAELFHNSVYLNLGLK